MSVFKDNRIKARRLRLNSFDICNFSKVPSFIIDAFFSEMSYKDTLKVCTFCFLNGISTEQMDELLLKINSNYKGIKRHHIHSLFKDFQQRKYVHKYYFYCTIRNVVSYLDGQIKHK